jgi:hypothetical protein
MVCRNFYDNKWDCPDKFTKIDGPPYCVSPCPDGTTLVKGKSDGTGNPATYCESTTTASGNWSCPPNMYGNDTVPQRCLYNSFLKTSATCPPGKQLRFVGGTQKYQCFPSNASSSTATDAIMPTPRAPPAASPTPRAPPVASPTPRAPPATSPTPRAPPAASPTPRAPPAASPTPRAPPAAPAPINCVQTVNAQPCDPVTGRQSWKRVTTTPAAYGGKGCLPESGSYPCVITIPIDLKQGKYVEVGFYGTYAIPNNILHLTEIQVYDQNNNLIPATATASSTYTDTNGKAYLPSFLVDGILTNFNHTKGQSNPWVKLTLNNNTLISRIVITNRYNGWRDRLLGAQIKIKDSNNLTVFTSDPIV